MTTTTAPADRMVTKAAKAAAEFAALARLTESNTVTETTEDERLMEWSALTRTYRVEVVDSIGRNTTCAWSVWLEPQEGRRRHVRFWGWGFSAYTKGERISLGLARVRVYNG